MDFKNYLKQRQAHIYSQLKKILLAYNSQSNTLNNSLEYCVLSNGKFLRPLLVYSSGESFGLSTSQLDCIAMAIELIHTYSLIHDDLPAMDNAKLRRGKLTCHLKFGEAEAILAGDALQMLAIEILTHAAYISNTKKLKLIEILSIAAGPKGMVTGQQLDIEAEGKIISLEELKLIHSLKTGALIKASIMMPLVLVNDENNSTLAEFSDLLGLAYQIQDDILDVEASTETLGKESGIDAKLGKNTYTHLLGIDAAKSYLQEIETQLFELLAKNDLENSLLAKLSHYILRRRH